MPDDTVTLPGFENMRGVELFQRLPLFRTLSFEETRRLFNIATSRRLAKGEVLIEERGIGEALHIVQAGTFRVTRGSTFLGCVGPGELLGEMSLVDDVLTSGRVAADTESEVLSIPRSDFDDLMERDHVL
ncbi:MAG: cyclic nucleotide-binding domain-containing protein, partial [Pseudomonadota bacterium]